MPDTIGKAQIEVSADSSGVDAGIARAKKSVASLGEAARKAGKESADGLTGVGKAGEEAGQRVDAATKRMIASLERQTAAIGNTKAGYAEQMAALRGLDQQALAPYIAKLREAERAQLNAGAGAKMFGVSVTAASAAVATAGVVGVASFAHWIHGAIDAADAMNDMSQRVGVSVKDLAAYKLAAEQSGTSLESIARGIKGLAVNMVEHRDALKAAGITATDSSGALRQLSDVFAAMPDGVEKTALATKLFGKAGMDLIPMLNLGSKGLEEAAQKSAKYAAAMEILAPQADKFNDSMAEVSLNAQLVGISFANKMMPQLTEISAAMAVAAQESGILMAALVGLGGILDTVFGKPRKTLADFNSEIQGVEAAIAKVAQTDPFKAAKVDALTKSLATLRAEREKLSASSSEASKPQELNIDAWKKKYKELYDAIKDGAEGPAKKAVDELGKLLDRIGGKASGLDASYWRDLDTLHAAYNKGRLSLDAYRDAVGKLTSQQKFAKDIAEKEAEAVKALGVQWAKQSEIFWEEVKAREAAGKFYQDTIDKLDLEATTLGMTSEAAQRYIATQELLKQKKQGLIESEDEYLDRLEKINAAFDRRDASKSIADAAKKAAEEWKKTGEIIERSLTDALMRGFESGKGFGENFRDTLVNMFKTLILRPVIQATVQGGLAAVGLGAPGAASAGGGVGGLLSNGSSLYNAFSGSTTGLYGQFATSSVGQALGLGTAATGTLASTAVGSGLVGGAGTVGLAAGVSPAVGGIGGGVVGGTTGTAASLTGLGSAVPYVGAAIAVASMLGLFDGGGPVDRNSKYQRAFGASDSSTGTPQAGGADPWRSNFRFSDSEMATSLASYNAGLIASEQNAIKSLGLTSDQIAAINVELNKSADAVYNFGIEHSDWLGSQADEQIAAVRLQAMATALGKSVAEIAASMDPLFGSLVNAGKSIGLTADQLLKVAGTSEQMQALTGNIGAYYTAFFTEQEKLAKTGDAFSAEFSKLGLAVPATKTEFRALVESLDLTTEAGQKSFAGLMSLSGAFAQYADAANTATAATQSATAAADASRKSMLAEQRARDTAAASTVADLTTAYADLQNTLRTDTRGTSGGSLGALGFSAAEAASVSQFAEYLDNANAKLDEIAKSPFAAELTGYTEQIKALAKSVQDQAADTLSAGRLSSGDVAGALAAQMAKTPLQFSDFMLNRQGARPDRSDFSTRADFDAAFANWDARKFSAGSFNAAQELSRVQASISLGNQASANALNVQNVGAVLGQLGQVAQSDEFRFTLKRQLADSVQVPIQGALMDVLYNAFDAATGALLQSDFTARGVGLAGVRAQQAQLAVYQTGSDVAAYEGALRNLNAALKAGVLGSADYETGLQAVNTLFAAVIPLVGDLDAQAQRITQASFELGTTGLSSIGYYFGQIGKQADQLAASAAAVSEPIAQATEAIGRMQSISTVFGESAIAAYRGLAGAGEQGAAYLSGGATQASIGNAALVSAAAGIAAEIMTTADAAKVAEKLSGQFAGSQRRDAALLLDGIQEYNAASFEKAFTRINAALARGGINEAQYIELFAQGVESFRGVDQEAEAVKTAMQSLAEAMGGFADKLLIDQQRTTIGAVQSLSELNRQYAVARDSATSGDREAVGKYQSLASAMLDKGLYDNQAAYNDAFGRVYGDARNLEAVGVNTLAGLNDGSNVVNELKNLNTSLSNRVEQLEKNLTIALAQIAKNTSRTSSGIEQINTVGLPA